VAQACNPSYSGGRDKQDHNLKPGLANRSQDPLSTIVTLKRAGGVAQVVEYLPSKSLEFKSQYQQEKIIYPYHFLKTAITVSGFFSIQ
jgi:hypothetical protein